MSHVIIGETPTGIISLLPQNITQEDIDRHDEKNLLKFQQKNGMIKGSDSANNRIRRAFSMPRNPFRLSRRSNKITEKDGQINASDRETGLLGKQQQPKSINEEVVAATTIAAYAGGGDGEHNEDESSNNDFLEQSQKTAGGGIGGGKKRLFRRSSLRKFITRIAQQMTSVNIGVKHAETDRVPPLGGYVWPPDQTPGVTGLRNHGNTCFMNAVLQCLSHTDILAEYFVLDLYKADLKRRNKINSKKFGTKGELTEQLALVLKALWTCKYDPEHSTSFKAVVDRYGSQFRSSTQHDAQEFLFWLLDKVHEDLNTAKMRKYKNVKNNYGRPDEVIAAETLANHIRCNNSFVQAVFQAQFRSSLTCPRCHKQSNTFDPFHCISVQLPQIGHQSVFVTVLYSSQHPKQVKLGLGVPLGSPIVALREQLHADTGIKVDRMILGEVCDTGFSRVFCDSHTMSSIEETDPVYCIETPEPSTDIRNLILCLTNVHRTQTTTTSDEIKRFGTPFCIQISRDVSYTDLQKQLLKEMSVILRPETFAYTTPLNEMFKIRLQDPSADPDTYIDRNVEHPLFTEMIDLALSVLPSDAGPPHVKLILEWSEPDKFFADMSDNFVEHESVAQLKEKYSDVSCLTLEQCLEHYTKAETLSTEDAWRCPHCQKYLPVVKTLGLWSLPDILVIHFKRFRQQHSKGPQSAKLTTLVKFPINGFDMTPHLARSPGGANDQAPVEDAGLYGEDNWSPWKKTRRKDSSLPRYHKDNRYDLYAVCYHQGDTLETGHYTAACKNPYDHQWYKFDDQRITHVPDESLPDDIVNNEAYILFYQRRRIDNMECSGTSSTSMDHWVSKIGVNSVPVSSASSVAGGDTKSEDKLREVILEVPIALEDENLSEPTIIADVVKIVTDPIDIPLKKRESLTGLSGTLEDSIPTIKEDNESNSSPPPSLPPPTSNTTITTAVIENRNSGEIPMMFEMDDISLPPSVPQTPQIDLDAVEPILDVFDSSKSEEIIETPSKSIEIVTNGYHNGHLSESNDDDDVAEIEIPAQPLNKFAQLRQKNVSPTKSSMIATTPPPNTTTTVTTTITTNTTNQRLSEIVNRKLDLNRKTICGTIVVNGSESPMNGSLSSLSSFHQQQNRAKECDTIKMIRGGSCNSCSKDTLMYIDQQTAHSLMDDDDGCLMGNRSLWISPVTPHKLITVSPKN